jgi:dihydrodipicolinate synthase/N-acetylneuraminate lyase
MSAVLLPFTADRDIDWVGFETHLSRTVTAGIIPAVNMDTGFGPYLSPAERTRVLDLTTPLAPDGFVAGALVDDEPGAPFDADAYARAMAAITDAGGTPIVFPSHGLAAVPEGDLVDAHARMTADVDRFLGFELGTMFHPAGRIWTIETFAAMLGLPALVGAKHSSLRRDAELDRLDVRDRVRPDFLVLTGNDLAIDQVIYGSDYLLGLSTFAPDAFARRDRAWAAGDELHFWELNDLLQYLGQLTFRAPVPGYRHDAAMFLELRGWIGSSRTHPDSPVRPAADRALLADIATRLDDLLR